MRWGILPLLPSPRVPKLVTSHLAVGSGVTALKGLTQLHVGFHTEGPLFPEDEVVALDRYMMSRVVWSLSGTW